MVLKSTEALDRNVVENSSPHGRKGRSRAGPGEDREIREEPNRWPGGRKRGSKWDRGRGLWSRWRLVA